jgi:hypothetical protein
MKTPRPPKPEGASPSPRHKARSSQKPAVAPRMNFDSAPFLALRKFAKFGSVGESEGNKQLEEIFGESDRASVILLVTLIDDTLVYLLLGEMRRLRRADYKNLFEGRGPLATFSTRIDICHALKLVDDQTRDALHIMREMRNACAHSRRKISFEDKCLQDLCLLLLPLLRKPPNKEQIESAMNKEPRTGHKSLFIGAAYSLRAHLMIDALEGVKANKKGAATPEA